VAQLPDSYMMMMMMMMMTDDVFKTITNYNAEGNTGYRRDKKTH
jgi:hypothetical protein